MPIHDASSPCRKPRCFSKDICSLHIKAGWSATLLLPCTGRGAQQLLFHTVGCSGPSDTPCSPGFLILLIISWQSHSSERAGLSQPHESFAVRSFKYWTLGEIVLKPSSHVECLHGPLCPLPIFPAVLYQPLIHSHSWGGPRAAWPGLVLLLDLGKVFNPCVYSPNTFSHRSTKAICRSLSPRQPSRYCYFFEVEKCFA